MVVGIDQARHQEFPLSIDDLHIGALVGRNGRGGDFFDRISFDQDIALDGVRIFTVENLHIVD